MTAPKRAGAIQLRPGWSSTIAAACSASMIETGAEEVVVDATVDGVDGTVVVGGNTVVGGVVSTGATVVTVGTGASLGGAGMTHGTTTTWGAGA